MFEDKQSLFPTFLGCGAFLLYGAAQLVAGYQGIAHHVGQGWAIAAAVAAFLRFVFPLTLGAFFGARDVWGWHWAAAALFTFPAILAGLALILAAPLRPYCNSTTTAGTSTDKNKFDNPLDSQTDVYTLTP